MHDLQVLIMGQVKNELYIEGWLKTYSVEQSKMLFTRDIYLMEG